MERRRYLVVAATALSSVAGCSEAADENTDQESTESATPSTTDRPDGTTSENIAETPKEAVRSYLTAVYSGDVQAANALVHPDGNVSEYTEDAAERNEALGLTIQSIESTDETENAATVRTVVSLDNPDADGAVTRSQVYTLQTDDGTWKLYASEEDEAA